MKKSLAKPEQPKKVQSVVVKKEPIVKEKKVNDIDSLSLYFMNSNAPEVNSKSKYIFWNDGQKKRFGEFNFFERIDDTLFIAVSWRKRIVNIEEYMLSNSQLNVSNKIVFDMNENEFKNACYEITNLNETILNKNIKLSLHINESCINENIIKELYLKL